MAQDRKDQWLEDCAERRHQILAAEAAGDVTAARIARDYLDTLLERGLAEGHAQ